MWLYPVHVLTIFEKYLSVCLLVCEWHNFCGRSVSKTNARNFINPYILCDWNINWCCLIFSVYHSRGCATMLHLSRFLWGLHFKNYLKLHFLLEFEKDRFWLHFSVYSRTRFAAGLYSARILLLLDIRIYMIECHITLYSIRPWH